MSNRIVVFWCLSFLMGVLCNYRDDFQDFTGCRMHVISSDYRYLVFYEIERDMKPDNESLIFDLHFWVLTDNNAHVLIAENDNVRSEDPAYEIVLGAGSNTFSEIRRQRLRQAKFHVTTVNLLSSIDFRPFAIHVWKDGLIQVHSKFDDTILMEWKDPKPLNIKYFSFGSWSTVKAKWFFDCPKRITGKSDESLLSNRRNLREDLFQNYSVLNRPVLNELDMTDVLLDLAPQYVSLDEYASKLLIKGRGNMKWIDERLRWNPHAYSNVSLLVLSPEEIWTPDLRLYDQKVDLQDVILHHNGSIFSNIFLDTNYWCNCEYLGSWPSDTHNCSLKFNFLRDGDMIRLLYLSNANDFFKAPLASEWTVVNVNIKYGLEFGDENLDLSQPKPPGIELILTLKRSSTVYKVIFLSPLCMIIVCCLATFWTSPFGCQKICFCCIQLILESVILTYISGIIPKHLTTVPTLITLYSSSLIASVVAVVISIIVINISREKHKRPIPKIIFYMLKSKICKYALFLPDVKIVDNARSKSSKPEHPMQDMWRLFGIAIDRYCVSHLGNSKSKEDKKI